MVLWGFSAATASPCADVQSSVKSAADPRTRHHGELPELLRAQLPEAAQEPGQDRVRPAVQ
jgi:hypothetical protein